MAAKRNTRRRSTNRKPSVNMDMSYEVGLGLSGLALIIGLIGLKLGNELTMYFAIILALLALAVKR
jgi:hypothetical protein